MLKLRHSTRSLTLPTAAACVVAVAVGASGAWAAPKVVALAKNSVGAPQLRANAVTSAKIAPKSVGASDLATNAVVSATIRNGSVGTIDLAGASVTGEKLAAGSVGLAQLGAGSVSSAAIVPGAIGSAQVADGSLGANDIVASGIGSANIADSAVTTAKLAAGSVTADKIAPGTIGVLSLTDGQVTTAKLANDAVTSAKILDGGIDDDDIATDAVTSLEIAPNAVNTTELALAAVERPKIAADAIDSGKIEDGSVGSADITNLGVATADIGVAQVTTSKIAPGTNGQVLGTTGGVAAWGTYGFPGDRTLVVRAGVSATDNGTALRAANTTVAASTGEWLIILEPGTYDLLATPLVLDNGANLQGAGSSTTTIVRSTLTGGGDVITSDSGTSPVTISGVSITASGGVASELRGISLPSSTATLELDDVHVNVENTTGDTRGIVVGELATVEAHRLEVDAISADDASAIQSQGGTVRIHDGDLVADGATSRIVIDLDGLAPSTIAIADSFLTTVSGIVIDDSPVVGSTFDLTGSEIAGDIEGVSGNLMRRIRDTVVMSGTIDGTAATITCSGADEVVAMQFSPLDENCQ